MFINRNQL